MMALVRWQGLDIGMAQAQPWSQANEGRVQRRAFEHPF